MPNGDRFIRPALGGIVPLLSYVFRCPHRTQKSPALKKDDLYHCILLKKGNRSRKQYNTARLHDND